MPCGPDVIAVALLRVHSPLRLFKGWHHSFAYLNYSPLMIALLSSAVGHV